MFFISHELLPNESKFVPFAKSTISAKAYKNMKAGFPKKKNQHAAVVGFQPFDFLTPSPREGIDFSNTFLRESCDVSMLS
mgnify:CR=1 FL=1